MGKRVWGLVVLVVAAAGRDGRAQSIRYREHDGGRIVVPVSINGTGPYAFLFDTGADTTMLDARLARKLGLEPARKTAMRTFAGRVEVPMAPIDRLSLGPWSDGPMEVAFADLAEMFGLPPDVQGILGQDTLARLSFLIVRRERRIELDPDGRVARELAGERLAAERKGGRYYVKGQPAGSPQPRRFLLDSGIPYPVVYDDPALDLQCSRSARAAESRIGARELRRCRIASVDLGGLHLTNLEVQVAARIGGPAAWEDGILPLALFDSVYFNSREGFVILNPTRAN
jgi:hypothetical protein